MLQKTAGIVLHTIKYTDSSSIATIYTQEFGRSAYIVYNRRSKKTVCKPAFLQPLSLVEIDAYHRPNKDVQHLKDIRVTFPFSSIPFSPEKNAIALFISEILYKSLRQSEFDAELYAFIEKSLHILDNCEENFANFHLVFLLKLARFIGFEPNTTDIECKYFDMLNGIFCTQKPPHIHYIANEQCQLFGKLVNIDFDSMHQVKISRDIRNQALQNILDFYKIHVPEFGTVQSLAILQLLFD